MGWTDGEVPSLQTAVRRAGCAEEAGAAAGRAPAPAGQPHPRTQQPPALSDPDTPDLQALADMVPEDTPAEPMQMDGPPPRQKRSWFKAKPKSSGPSKTQIIKGPDGKLYRVCPHCGRQTRSDDLYMDVFCSNCGKTIPAASQTEEMDLGGASLVGGHGKDRDLTVGFYDGLVQAFTYPLGSIQSVLMGTLVAIGVIIVPTLVMMGLIYVMKQEPVNGDKFDVGSWPGLALFGVLMVELAYCAGVGFYALIDSIRSTVSGAEKPPELVWNLTTVMASLIGYIGFVVFYAALILLGVWVSGGLDKTPTTLSEIKGLVQGSGMYAYLAILTFFMPMTIIGLATGAGLQGLNPFRIVRSIAAVVAHYFFLYCIMLVYAGLIGVATVTMIEYTGDAIVKVYKLRSGPGSGSDGDGGILLGGDPGGGVLRAVCAGAHPGALCAGVSLQAGVYVVAKNGLSFVGCRGSVAGGPGSQVQIAIPLSRLFTGGARRVGRQGARARREGCGCGRTAAPVRDRLHFSATDCTSDTYKTQSGRDDGQNLIASNGVRTQRRRQAGLF